MYDAYAGLSAAHHGGIAAAASPRHVSAGGVSFLRVRLPLRHRAILLCHDPFAALIPLAVADGTGYAVHRVRIGGCGKGHGPPLVGGGRPMESRHPSPL